MGYMRHHAIVVTGWNEAVDHAHQFAKDCFPPEQVSEIIGGVVNGYTSFFVGPDGSKEGWGASHEGDDNRDEFIGWLLSQLYADNSSPLAWVEVQYGDDECQTKIVRDSDQVIREKGYNG